MREIKFVLIVGSTHVDKCCIQRLLHFVLSGANVIGQHSHPAGRCHKVPKLCSEAIAMSLQEDLVQLRRDKTQKESYNEED